jgi:pimeloyl-ACP methyl ester carboxylesterase
MSRFRFLLLVIAAVLAWNVVATVRADDVPGDGEAIRESDSTTSHWNVPMKTLGGRQFWGDVRFFHDWRIQHNILDGHYRLLDGDDVRHAWGTLEQCERKLEEIRTDRKLPPMSGRAVILVHGAIRSSKSFDAMKAELEKAGYHVFGFDYPSTRVEIRAGAEYLKQCVASLDGITEINFVVHSMGGLVVRASLIDDPDPRIRRIVMLAVPNLGARMANLLQRYTLYRLVYGPAGQQLIEDAEGFISQLPTPACEFALISGARGTPTGFNPLIPGDDDGTISLACTRLPGAKDFMTVHALHSFLMREPDVIAATVRFLRTGVLRESGETEPIPHMSDVTAPSDTSLTTSMP